MSSTRLLLVDDEERFLETTRKLLQKRGVETFTAANGIDALKVLEDHRIDVVILDVKMPGLDGVEVLRKIKQKYPLIEVVMLTGHASVESAVEGLKLGAYDYVMKPLAIEDMLKKVNEAYDKKRAMEDKIRKAKVDRIISHPMAVFEKEED
ncbi:MAG: response regulator [Candidatus Abyssobacteria bacterium SURF_17]|uniref:Response regulator n=1 Tax=Candidatus Abyssobacteria bacterium SURF_17 TaxID=2093361 RepID=A0A419F8C2_9BACT|nr:MAG: response regulator [Candidatus Abyssubacteria bacterium SURF_17]